MAHDLLFKTATESWEAEAIHLLNHDIFAGEIEQHAPRPSRRLVDAFDRENLYFICL